MTRTDKIALAADCACAVLGPVWVRYMTDDPLDRLGVAYITVCLVIGVPVFGIRKR